uniref:Uncharacterized protein n=1 Tax=Panagrolaimus sp. ES5 TaxID=591445 RepID=A0AC34F5M0_9BILA
MGNKQSYNVADANSSLQTVKPSSGGGENIESEVAFTFDSAAKGINMKKSDDNDNYVQYDILYRIDPLPHIPFSLSTDKVEEGEFADSKLI